MQDLSKITMSSLEISKLTTKAHDKVVKDIIRILAEVNIDSTVFRDTYLDSYSRERICYNLPKRECDLVVSGYSAKYRLTIIDRWQQLEQERLYGGFKLPTTYEEALESLLITVKDKKKLEQQAVLNEPKVKAFDGAKAIFPNKESSEGEKASKKDVNDLYPFLRNDKINNILEFYTSKKYKDTKYYVMEEVVECMKEFFKDCKYRISDSRISVIATHKCLLNSKCVISKEYAIEYLNFLEEEFDL